MSLTQTCLVVAILLATLFGWLWRVAAARLEAERRVSDTLSLWIESLAPVPLTRRKSPPPLPDVPPSFKWGRLTGYLPRFLFDDELY